MMRWSSDRADTGSAMVVRAGAGGSAVAAGTWDFTGALEQAANRAATSATTDSLSATALTLISQPSDAPVYLIVYAYGHRIRGSRKKTTPRRRSGSRP